jgi:hypothetical protein
MTSISTCAATDRIDVRRAMPLIATVGVAVAVHAGAIIWRPS